MLSFFDMNMRVALPEPLQFVCWNSDINHFSEIKVGVLESVSDIKNSSSDILIKSQTGPRLFSTCSKLSVGCRTGTTEN